MATYILSGFDTVSCPYRRGKKKAAQIVQCMTGRFPTLLAFVIKAALGKCVQQLLTLPLQSLLVSTPFTNGGRSSRPPSYLKNRCPHEREIF